MGILDPVPDPRWAERPHPTQQGLVGLSQPIVGSIFVGCHGEFFSHPNTLREMTRYKDTRLRGCVCVHALIQGCLLQAQLCLNKKTKETESQNPFPWPPSCVS